MQRRRCPLDMTKHIHYGPVDFAAQLLLNHLFTRVIRGLIVFWRERDDDLLEAPIAAERVPEGHELEHAVTGNTCAIPCDSAQPATM